MDGSVLGSKLAEFEQVAAACSAKSSREVDESVTTSEHDLENTTE